MSWIGTHSKFWIFTLDHFLFYREQKIMGVYVYINISSILSKFQSYFLAAIILPKMWVFMFLFLKVLIHTHTHTHIYCHPQTDCFVVSQLFSVARHLRCLKLGSKPAQLYVRLSIMLHSQHVNHVSSGVIKHSSFRLFTFLALLDTRVLNSFEELCVMWVAVVNSFARVLNTSGGAYILSFTDCLAVSQLISVDRQIGRLKLGSKPAQLYIRLSIILLSQQVNHVSSGIIRHYGVGFVCLRIYIVQTLIQYFALYLVLSIMYYFG